MRRNVIKVALGMFCAVAVPAQAQIISTSIPQELAPGKSGTEKKWTLHLMVSPLARWNYGEVYFNVRDFGDGTALVTGGAFDSTIDSDYLFATEAGFSLPKNWSISVGGWYNKLGSSEFDYAGQLFYFDTVDPTNDFNGVTTFKTDVDLEIMKGHVGVFWKNFGLQGGALVTKAKSDGTIRDFTFEGQPAPGLENVFPGFDERFTDWDVFAVFKKDWGKKLRWGVSAGAGAYFKEGSETTSLRGVENQTVLSGFVTGNFQFWKGLGLDASVWYVGETEETRGANAQLAGQKADSQLRLMIGIGYTF